MSKIKYDGYYYSFKSEKDNYDSYNCILRFFEKKNKVISVSISPSKGKRHSFGNYFPAGDWFNEKYNENGEFKVTENKISFNCGRISYNGTILNEDELGLFSHSYINNYETTEIFKFISFNALKDIKELDKL